MILVTGATGFIGKNLLKSLSSSDFNVGAVVRCHSLELPKEVKQYEVGDLAENTNWDTILTNVDTIIHLAARAHILKDGIADPLAEFRKINCYVTRNLAKQAIKANVRRFIYISSIGVNGNNNSQPFTEADKPSPIEPYALSKYEAELELIQITQHSDMDIVIIRPPLVYGPNAPGNFGNLLRFLNMQIPLPFGAINNKRSFIGIANLTDFIIQCIKHPQAANETFLISDGEDVSTTQFLQKTVNALGKKTLLLPVPVYIMKFFLHFIGKNSLANRLFSSLQINNSKAKNLLNWKPIKTMDEQLQITANIYDLKKNI